MSSAYVKQARVGDTIEAGVGQVTVEKVERHGVALHVRDALGREHYIERADRGVWLRAFDYVRRERDERVGWVGPIPASRSGREVDAWRKAGWSADAYPDSPELRRHVDAWQRQADIDHGRA